MLKKIIRREKISRKKNNEIKYGVLGAEIRGRRLKISKTLASTVKEVCSVSYLCKLEKNNIKPNKLVLMELCSRLDLDDNQTKNLLGIQDLLAKAVKAYRKSDSETLKTIFEQVKIFNNYRSKLIMFIYHIYNRELENANSIDKELVKLVGGMNEEDLKIYFCFHAVFSFYNQYFKDSFDDLDELTRFYELNIDLKMIVYQYKLYSELKLNSSRIIETYNKARDLFLNIGDYKALDNANYVLAFYYLQNKDYIQYSRIYKKINCPSYKYTLLLIVKLIFNKKCNIKYEWVKNARPIGVFVYNYYKNKKLFIEKVNELTDLDFNYDFSPMVLEYMALNSELDRYNFVNNIALRNILVSNDGSAVKFFMEQYSLLCYRHTKYKSFYEFYFKVKDLI